MKIRGEWFVNIAVLMIIAVVAGAILLETRGSSRGPGEPPGEPRGAPRGAGAPPARRGEQATAVIVAPVSPGTVRTTVRTNGEVMVRTAVNVIAPVAGRVTAAPPPVGTVVQSGAPLAEVDPSRPGETFSRSTVTSPVAGTITAVAVNTGDTVTPQSTLATVSDLAALEIRTWIPERFVGVLRPGLQATVSFEAFPRETFTARVVRLAPQLDPASRTLEVVLELSGRHQRIRPGMFAAVELVTGERTNVITVPRSAVVDSWQEHVVFVVDEEGRARRRSVELGMEGGGTVEITGGLQGDEQLVVRGQSFLSDGALVHISGEQI